jgi:hypothetical protein
MMRETSSLYALLILDLLASFILSFMGLWYFIFVPSALLGYLLKSRWMNLVYFGVTGGLGAVIPIFLSDITTRLDTGGLLAGILGVPGGFAIPLALTGFIAFLLSGLAAVATSSVRDIS